MTPVINSVFTYLVVDFLCIAFSVFIIKKLTTDLLLNGKITTTEDRAKEVKAIADSIVSLAIKEKDNFYIQLFCSFSVCSDECLRVSRKSDSGKKPLKMV